MANRLHTVSIMVASILTLAATAMATRMDASDTCEGTGISVGPGSVALRCLSACEDGCAQVSITHPNHGQGTVCICDSQTEPNYCCQLGVFSGPVISAIGFCEDQDDDCDDGSECNAMITFGPPEDPFPAVIEHFCSN
jgi:hypothetical protein